MSAIAQVRTVRASNPNTTSQTSTKPANPFNDALATFRADVKTAESVDSEAARAALTRLVAATNATGEDVAAATKAVEDAKEALKGFVGERDALVTRQRRAIRAALQAGFKGTEIGAAFSVSGGTVSNVKVALDVKAALVKANAPTVPSDDALVSRVAKAAKVTGGKAALMAAAKAGTLPEDGDVETFTAAQALKAVQRATDAVKGLTRADGDTETVAAIRAAITALSALTIA
jgi:small-conductance mechanosensitive channel